MTPPTATLASVPASVPDTDASSPYHLRLSGGYTSFALGNDAPTYSGSQFQASIGQSFPISPGHGFFLNGVFRSASLNDGSRGHDVSMAHFGVEGGYEGPLIPAILSVSLFAGLGTNVFYSQQFNIASSDIATSVTRSLNNQSDIALTLGGEFGLVGGILFFSGGIQPNFGLSVPPGISNGVPLGYNPIGKFIMGGLDLARLTDRIGGSPMPRDISFEQFIKSIQSGFLLETTYTYNPANPADGNALRVFDTRNDRPMFNYMKGWLDRPVDENNPVGFRIDFGVGENVPILRSRSSFIGGDTYDLQQWYLRSHLPIGHGLEVHVGKSDAPVGSDVIPGWFNNHISHSWQFGKAEPADILGITATYPFVKDVFAATAGIYNGWDNIGLDPTSGIGGLLNLSVNPASFLSFSGTVTVGNEFGRTRRLIDAVATLKYNDAQSTADNYDRGTLAIAYDRGHEGAGAGQPESNWDSVMATGRVNFSPKIGYAQRFEVFTDPQGVRTGTPQTMWETTGTVLVTPLSWLQLRAEYRHDQSSAQSFQSGQLPVNSQDTFGLGVGVLFQSNR